MGNESCRSRMKLFRVARLTLGIGLLLWVALKLDLAAVRNVLGQTSYLRAVLGAALAGASQLATGLSWYFGLCVALGRARPGSFSPGTAVSLFWESLLFAVTTPGGFGGDAFRIRSLRQYGMTFAMAVVAEVNERLNRLAAAVCVAGVAGWLFADQAALGWLRPAGLVAAVFLLAAVPRVVLAGSRRFSPELGSGRLQFEVLALAAAMLAHLIAAVGVAVAAYPMLPALTFTELLTIAALAKAIRVLGIAPVGLGVVEASTVYFTWLMGGSLAEGGALAVLQRCLAILACLMIGATVVLWRRIEAYWEG